MAQRGAADEGADWASELLPRSFRSVLSSPEAAAPASEEWSARWSRSKNCYYYYVTPPRGSQEVPPAQWHLPASARITKWSGGAEAAPTADEGQQLHARCVCGQLALALPRETGAAVRCSCGGCRRSGAAGQLVLLPVPGLRFPDALGAARTLRTVRSVCGHLGTVDRHFCSHCFGSVGVSPHSGPQAWDGLWDLRFSDGRGVVPKLWRFQRPAVEYLNARVEAAIVGTEWTSEELAFSLVLRVAPPGWGSRYDVRVSAPEPGGALARGSQTVSGGAFRTPVQETFELVRSAGSDPPPPPPMYIHAGAVEDESVPAQVAQLWAESGVWCAGESSKLLDAAPLCAGFQSHERSSPVTGGCSCGACQYSAVIFPGEMQHCYCGLCRRLSGGPFQTWIPCDDSSFQWTRQEALMLRQTTPGGKRHACARCGCCFTILYASQPGKVWIAGGSVSDESLPKDPGQRLYRVSHICCGWMPSWHKLPDDQLTRVRGPG